MSELIEYKRRLEALHAKVQARLPSLVEARRKFFRSKSRADGDALDLIESELRELNEEFDATLAEFQQLLGIDSATLDELEQASTAHYERNLSRSNFTEDRVDVTRMLDEDIPEAIERLRRLLPADWLTAEPREACSLTFQIDGFLSLTKGMRARSESPSIHRLRQLIYVAEDFRDNAPRFDHFAGATILPVVAHLGRRLDLLDDVGGDVAERLRRLWMGSSDDVDGTVFELLTAIACVERGRSIEFIAETNEPTPDLRVSDPVPMVIECKRQRALSLYELEEESYMQVIFRALRLRVRELGCFGNYHLMLEVEARGIDVPDVVNALVAQRLVINPETPTKYAWGSVAYHERPSRAQLPRSTRLYSPYLLEIMFDWQADLPEWDGLCCSYDNDDEEIINEATRPVGLLWTNASDAALKKRTWAPINLFGSASHQIPAGEFAIIYLAYAEGARAEIADRRLAAFTERLEAWSHRPEIRIPIAFLNRLYPRSLGDGRPDLIESTVLWRSQNYGEPSLFNVFPANVFSIGA